jgi:hypothetical protein
MGEGASQRDGWWGAYTFEIAGLGALDSPEGQGASKITVQWYFHGPSNSEVVMEDHLLARTMVLSWRFQQAISLSQQLTWQSTHIAFTSPQHGVTEVPVIHVDIQDRAIVVWDYPTSSSVVYYHTRTVVVALHLQDQDQGFQRVWESTTQPFAEMNDGGWNHDDFLELQTDGGTGQPQARLGVHAGIQHWVSGTLIQIRGGASVNKDTTTMVQDIQTPLSKVATLIDVAELLRKWLLALAMARAGPERLRMLSFVAPFLLVDVFTELAKVSRYQWRAAWDYARGFSLFEDDSTLTTEFDVAKWLFIGVAERGIGAAWARQSFSCTHLYISLAVLHIVN